MADGGMLRELLDYTDWARERVLATALPLGDEALDRPFEMGPGSIRRTVLHICAADEIWLARWEGSANATFDDDPAGRTMGQIAEHWRAVNARRRVFLESAIGAKRLRDLVSYKNLKGVEYRQELGQLALHTFNHGQHHRAQLANMLRLVGAALPKPGVDYIYYKREQGGTAAPFHGPELATLRGYFAYGDWATDRLLAAMEAIPEAAWSRRFDLGLGTLPMTILHVQLAEEWWLQNWTRGPGAAFPSDTDFGSIESFGRRRDAHRGRRDAFLQTLSEADVAGRMAAGESTTGKRFEFPIGATMIQLGLHGTHHRAQALNMVRQLGGKPPGLDYVAWMREMAGVA